MITKCIIKPLLNFFFSVTTVTIISFQPLLLLILLSPSVSMLSQSVTVAEINSNLCNLYLSFNIKIEN